MISIATSYNAAALTMILPVSQLRRDITPETDDLRNETGKKDDWDDRQCRLEWSSVDFVDDDCG